MKEIKTMEDLDAALEESKSHPVLLYKHSTVCPVSASAHGRVRTHEKADAAGALPPIHLVKVIESRPISNAIEERLGVRHESPQIILVKDGQAVADTSHREITGDWIDETVAEHH